MKVSRIVITGVGALALVAGGTAAGAAIAGPVSSGIIHGCYTTTGTNGSHTLVLQNAGTACPAGDTAIKWNEKGPAGPPGVADVDRGTVQWTGGGGPGQPCTLTQVAGPDASSISVETGSNPPNFCVIDGLPSGSIVLVSPIGSIGSVGAQSLGFSGPSLDVNTSGSQGEFSFAAFPGS
jgi:hypothetical protein